MASLSWGIDAETLGSLMMLASGVRARSPSFARSSGTRWASVNHSGNAARMRPASEMYRVSTDTPVPFVKARTMGSNDRVASAGASSVQVHMIDDVLVFIHLSFEP